MKAPDKIYLNKYMIRPGMLYPAQYPADTPEFEYIRKDALLDWAKERKEQMKIEAGGCSNMLATGEYLAYDKLIEKIKSM